MNATPAAESGAFAPASAAADRGRWWALAALLIGLSMIVIDGSVVNILLPDMVEDIGLSTTDVLWVNSIYSLIFASLLITVGLVADRFGRKRLFMIGTVIFLLGSFASGASQGPEMLITFRAVQAFGAAMMLPSSIAVINVMFTGRSRAMAFGAWGAVFGGAAALGPLLGGWLTEEFSWRWAFYINVPVAVISLFMVWRYVVESRVGEVRGFDPVGVILSVLGLGLIVFALIEGSEYGWWLQLKAFTLGPITVDQRLSLIPFALVLGLLGLVLLVLWSFWRTQRGQTALVDLELFKIRRYGYGNLVALVVSLGEFGILFVIPLWIQAVAGFDPLTTGVILAALAVGAFAAGGLARHLAAAIGPTRVVRVGMALEIVGILGIAVVLSPTRSPWWLVLPLIVYGVGLGLASAQLTSVVLQDVPADASGRASAMTSTFRQIGSALGAAILGAVLFAGLGYFTTQDIESISVLPPDQQAQIVDAVRGSAGQAIPQLEKIPGLESEVTAAKAGYTTAARDTAHLAAIFVMFGLLVSFGLPRDHRGTVGYGDTDR